VSHDRAFLDNVVTQTIAYEGEGKWKEYVGGYSDWERMRAKPAPEAKPSAAAPAAPPPSRPRKLSYNESRELEGLPAALEALEREQADLAAKLADPATYQDRATDVRAMNARHEEIEAELTRLLARWEELESRA
jgi:ATP-binding cassette subfamily F protein uup